jgi:integrase
MRDQKRDNRKITERFLTNLTPKPKPYKVVDGQGLFLHVTPAGGKIWRVNYRFEGKQQTLTLGPYPRIGLNKARDFVAKAKNVLKKGLNPAKYKNRLGLSAPCEKGSFEAVANEFLENRRSSLSERYFQSIKNSLKNHLFPFLGHRPIDDIDPPELLAALRQAEGQGKFNTTGKLKVFAGLVFRYAIATGKATRDVSADLRGALKPSPVNHYPSLTKPADLRRLLLAIDSYPGNPVVKFALQLASLVFVRPGELQKAEWSEFDLEKAEWRIPAAKMKMKRPHVVPLSRQALEVVDRLKPYSEKSRYLFPRPRSLNDPINPGQLTYALRSLGFTKEEIVPHGFRSIASTVLNEQGYNRDWIERQLAHVPGGVRAAYNYAEYLKERRRMAQDWADYLDRVKAGKE